MLSFVLESRAAMSGSPLLTGHRGPAIFAGQVCRQESRTVPVARYPTPIITRQMQSLSGIGLVLGTLFFAAALTPTLGHMPEAMILLMLVLFLTLLTWIGMRGFARRVLS